MAKQPRITVTKESTTGRNVKFQDNKTGESMTRGQLNKKIDNGNYPDYHTRMVHGKKTPVSNPDKTKKNNLD